MTDKERLEQIYGKMKKVVPVAGTVTINGIAQPGVVITLHNADGTSRIPIRPAITDDDGKYGFTTYLAADGIEPGKYKLTFQWLEIVRDKKLGNQMQGPDKLKKAFDDPVKSPFSFEVEEDSPQSELDFDLKKNG